MYAVLNDVGALLVESLHVEVCFEITLKPKQIWGLSEVLHKGIP